MSLILTGALGSLLAGLATGVGALPVLFLRRLSDRVQDGLLGFAAGVMLAASVFSLIIPAMEAAQRQGSGQIMAALTAIGGILLGGATIWAINSYAPHEHFVLGRQGKATDRLKRIWLFVIAITLHNFPEGLAVGVGFGSGDMARGMTLAIGIGIQNAPEGLAVAAALRTLDYKRSHAFLIALCTGLVEPIGGLIGAAAVSVAEPVLPWGLAFAAGAMLWVISGEIIPETHREGHQTVGTAGLMVGFVVMMLLDTVFG